MAFYRFALCNYFPSFYFLSLNALMRKRLRASQSYSLQTYMVPVTALHHPIPSHPAFLGVIVSLFLSAFMAVASVVAPPCLQRIYNDTPPFLVCSGCSLPLIAKSVS
ncbi:hypothetical protein LZ30DRAFT_39283 [Colletotrichum cereale]|nr:hypothetical protein LZ30DRAFT_39283 [Colletotrichum cereale]